MCTVMCLWRYLVADHCLVCCMDAVLYSVGSRRTSYASPYCHTVSVHLCVSLRDSLSHAYVVYAALRVASHLNYRLVCLKTKIYDLVCLLVLMHSLCFSKVQTMVHHFFGSCTLLFFRKTALLVLLIIFFTLDGHTPSPISTLHLSACDVFYRFSLVVMWPTGKDSITVMHYTAALEPLHSTAGKLAWQL